MAKRPDDLSPESMKQLNDPVFMAWVHDRFRGGEIQPEDQDFDLTAPPRTDKEAGEQYRLAQARRLMRLYAEWKAGQN